MIPKKLMMRIPREFQVIPKRIISRTALEEFRGKIQDNAEGNFLNLLKNCLEYYKNNFQESCKKF